MNRRLEFLLVVLQLCIGWHLFYEGVWKIKQGDEWSSRNFVHAATGPFALPLRWVAGDPIVTRDGWSFGQSPAGPDILARLQLPSIDAGSAENDLRPHPAMPPVIDQEWNAYFSRFVKHYQLDAPDRGAQLARAEEKLRDAKSDFAQWRANGTVKIKPIHFAGTAEVGRNLGELLEEFSRINDKVRSLEATDQPVFGSKAIAVQVRQLNLEAAAIRDRVIAVVDAKSAQWKQELFWQVLTPDQRRMDRLSYSTAPKAAWANVEWLDGFMTPLSNRLGLTWPVRDRVGWIDWSVRWGLTLAGAGLILGLLTKTACFVGCLLLALFYIAMPPLPGAPESPGGHYLFINYNVIETVALLAIAASKPANRFGLDALAPWQWRRRSCREQ
jgi:uncharacterized membrane protein YphA (DoxX/SURF4 family)